MMAMDQPPSSVVVSFGTQSNPPNPCKAHAPLLERLHQPETLVRVLLAGVLLQRLRDPLHVERRARAVDTGGTYMYARR